MSDRAQPRLFVLRVLVAALLCTLFGRLWFLQVVDGDSYAQAASANRVREVVTPAARGDVYDVQGRPLLTDRTALVVSVDRSALLREPGDGAAVLQRLSPVVGLTPEQLSARITPCGTRRADGTTAGSADDCWAGSPYQPVPVATVDPRDEAALRRVLVVQEQREDFPAVEASFTSVRDRPQGTLAGHVLGYLGPIAEQEVDQPEYAGVQPSALIGRAGVEQTYERALRGVDGVQELLVDKDGRVTGSAGTTPAQPGDRLVLSIDSGVQALAERELEAAVLAARQRPYYRGGRTVADSGSVVVMEATTGRVVAAASYPSYDPGVFTGGISRADYAALTDEANGSPLLFRAVQGAYAPASTFKVISSLAAVENGQASFSSRIDCPGVFDPTGQTNFEAADLGSLTLRTSIVRSCDTNFYKFAYDAWLRDGGNRPVSSPKDPMITMARAFGLGDRTGIDLPSESSGVIPTRAWRQQYWESIKADVCAGAQNPAFDAARRARNRDACVDGFRFRGGQATNFAIGQGETLLTPLQLASVYATVANGGTVMQPTVGRALVSADGSRVSEIAPTPRSTVPVRPETLAQLRDALHGVTSEPGGTAYGVFAGLPLAVAGKTGTGQVTGKQDTSWFASFAPADAPRLVVVAQVSQGGTGSSTAAPLVRKMYEGIFGLAGSPALLPGGQLPPTLPVVQPDGTVAPPGTPVVPPPGSVLAAPGGGVAATAARADAPPLAPTALPLPPMPRPRPPPPRSPHPVARRGRGGERPEHSAVRADPPAAPRRVPARACAAARVAAAPPGLAARAGGRRAARPGLAAGVVRDPSAPARRRPRPPVLPAQARAQRRDRHRAAARPLRWWTTGRCARTPPSCTPCPASAWSSCSPRSGATINGAHSWIVLPAGFQVQPSEFAKVAVVVGMAMLLGETRDGEDAPRDSDVAAGAGARGRADGAGHAAARPRDHARARLRRARCAGRRRRAPTRWILGLLLAGTVVAAERSSSACSATTRSTGSPRSPTRRCDPRGAGYNTNQARIAIGSGGVTGTGLFEGTQTSGRFIPEQQTDFVFTVAGEELGLLGGGSIIALVGRGAVARAADRLARRRRLRPPGRGGRRQLVRVPELRQHRDDPGDHAGDRTAAALRLVRRVGDVRQPARRRPAAERPRPQLRAVARAAARRGSPRRRA